MDLFTTSPHLLIGGGLRFGRVGPRRLFGVDVTSMQVFHMKENASGKIEKVENLTGEDALSASMKLLDDQDQELLSLSAAAELGDDAAFEATGAIINDTVSANSIAAPAMTEEEAEAINAQTAKIVADVVVESFSTITLAPVLKAAGDPVSADSVGNMTVTLVGWGEVTDDTTITGWNAKDNEMKVLSYYLNFKKDGLSDKQLLVKVPTGWFIKGVSTPESSTVPTEITAVTVDDEYKDAESTQIRLEVIALLKEYGRKVESEKLSSAVQQFKESQPMLSRLARLIQTSNAMRDTLSGSALNVIKREIIKTLSIETENDADLEADGGTYLGIESGTQEFKTSIIYPSNNNMQPDEYTQTTNVLKGVCAFLNSTTGGVLYLGVNDQGYVTGLENDMKYLKQTSIDSYLRYVQDAAKKHFGIDTLPYLRIEPLYDNRVVAIHVEPHPYRVVELNNTAYLRVNAESREMPENVRQQLIARKVFTNKNQAAAISLLQHACSQKKCVVLHNYASSNSGKVADRTVEAYDVRPEDGLAICYDCKKLECSVFKINRIGYVEILDSEPWSHTAVHKKIDVDVFHMSGTKPVAVSLQLDLMAKNLLIEEFPSAKDCIKPHKGDNNIWYFDTEVYQMEGIGRFYLGLANHIKILQAPELEKYVAAFVKENLQAK